MYPSVISTLPDPQASDRLNSPSHSGLHRSENAAIEEIQNYVGTLASAAGTLTYDIRSPLSNGGGHIQTTDKGGTGQTSYTKGDLLVASSPSVLTKLAVGTDDQVLIADTAQSTGIKWGNSTSKIAVISSLQGVSGVGTTTVIFAASVAANTLRTNNAIRFTGAISQIAISAGRTITFNVNYGNNSILSMTGTANAASGIMNGKIEGIIVADNSSVLQKGNAVVQGYIGNSEADGDANLNITKYLSAAYGTSSVNSAATQNLIVTATHSGGDSLGSVFGQFFVVEKIA